MSASSIREILVTGATGHLGAKVLERLGQIYTIHAIVRTMPAVACPGIIYHVIDLSGNWSADVLPNRIDVVIHLAQSRHFREFPQQAVEIFNVNLVSTAKLLDYASRAGVKHFILASTGGLHRPSETVIDESSLVEPPDGPLEYYFRSKQAAELLASPYKMSMDVTVLRPFFIYGPGQSPDKLIARLVASIRDGQPIRLVGRDGLVINPVFVDDVVELIHAILDTPGSRTLMVAGPDALSMRAIAEAIGREVGGTPIFEQTEGEKSRLVANHRAVEALLGRSLTGFSEGVSRLLQ